MPPATAFGASSPFRAKSTPPCGGALGRRSTGGTEETGAAGGEIAAHIRDLTIKASLQAKGRLDQTLLLRALASRLRGSNWHGAFMGDAMMKLGLLGTVIGFIMMLAPIAGLDVENQGAVKSSMALMSDGMAVAMYTTLAGLAGALLLKIQYSMLEHATAKLFAFAVELTEVHVVPVLERRMGNGGGGMNGDFDCDSSAREEPFDPFSVVLFKALQALSALFFVALLAVPLANKGKVDSKAEFLITMNWPDNHPDDIDLFVQDPTATSCGTGGARRVSWCWSGTIAAASTISS